MFTHTDQPAYIDTRTLESTSKPQCRGAPSETTDASSHLGSMSVSDDGEFARALHAARFGAGRSRSTGMWAVDEGCALAQPCNAYGPSHVMRTAPSAHSSGARSRPPRSPSEADMVPGNWYPPPPGLQSCSIRQGWSGGLQESASDPQLFVPPARQGCGKAQAGTPQIPNIDQRASSTPPGMIPPGLVFRPPPGLDDAPEGVAASARAHSESYVRFVHIAATDDGDEEKDSNADKPVKRTGNKRRQKQRERRRSNSTKNGSQEPPDDEDEDEDEPKPALGVVAAGPVPALVVAAAPVQEAPGNGSGVSPGVKKKAKPKKHPVMEGTERQEELEALGLAVKIRFLASEQLRDGWHLLHSEFETQRLVWSSLSMVQRWDMVRGTRPELQVSTAMDIAFEFFSADSFNALQALEDALNLDAKHNGVLNAAVRSAGDSLLRRFQISHCRQQLADHVEACASKSPSHVGDAQAIPELVKLLRLCEIEDASLIRLSRKVLSLPEGLDAEPALLMVPTKAVVDEQAVKKKKKDKKDKQETKDHKSSRDRSSRPEKSNQSVGSGISAGSAGSASRRSCSRRGRRLNARQSTGTSRGSSRSKLSSNSSLGSSRSGDKRYSQATAAKAASAVAAAMRDLRAKNTRGTPAQGKEHGTIGGSTVQASALPGEDIAPGLAEGAAAAAAVHILAGEEFAAAWHLLEQEFATQVLVWSSQFNASKDRKKKECDASIAQQRMKSLLGVASSDPSGAARALQALLHWDEEHDMFNRVTREAAIGVVTAEDIAQWRWGMAERLELSALGEQVDLSPQELGEWIAHCQLCDLGLEYRIRRVLGLNLGNLRERCKTLSAESQPDDAAAAASTTPHPVGVVVQGPTDDHDDDDEFISM